MTHELITAIIPAAGVGKRMKQNKPKQYLLINGLTVIEHTVSKFLLHPNVGKIVIAISDGDPYFPTLAIASHPDVICVAGGKERADTVLNALDLVVKQQLSEWVLIHDAARPCVTAEDIDHLIDEALVDDVGAILATPVRDTMKRSDAAQNIVSTESRDNLWHALTPQMFRAVPLQSALSQALSLGVLVTDDASAMEIIGLRPHLVAGRADNIKITQPEDLVLAEFYLTRGKEK